MIAPVESAARIELATEVIRHPRRPIAKPKLPYAENYRNEMIERFGSGFDLRRGPQDPEDAMANHS
ncbi:hypothetical protein HYZ99_02350 [Candidatus Peregrinibacteria bacterium]|nr:hypothetical protein [Candidatus Peregrinibacteria bacterium]